MTRISILDTKSANFHSVKKAVDLFDTDNEITSSRDQVFRSKGYDIVGKRKTDVVVLINEGSASASEIVAGALKEHGIAKLVGENTFGKGSVQELIDVTDETALKVTIARWLTPEGVSISDGGLAPDYEVEISFQDDEMFIDTQLEKAIELLNFKSKVDLDEGILRTAEWMKNQ